jgi:hypothetical protein
MCQCAVTYLDIKSYSSTFAAAGALARAAVLSTLPKWPGWQSSKGGCLLSNHARVTVRQGCHLNLRPRPEVAACRRARLESTVPVAYTSHVYNRASCLFGGFLGEKIA